MPIVSKIENFKHETSGNTAIIWALLLLPIMVLIGAAVDFSRHQSNTQSLASNLDSAAIASARYILEKPDADAADLQAFANNYLVQAFDPTENRTLDYVSITEFTDVSLTIEAQSTISSTLLGLAGVPELASVRKSVVNFGNPMGGRAVLVLDNSFSMKGEKLDALEDAAESFINIMLVDDENSNYVGVVPFGHYVNVGLDREGESWLVTPPDDLFFEERECEADYDGASEAGCEPVAQVCHKTIDGEASSRACNRWSCPDGLSFSSFRQCEDVRMPLQWCGAVNSRLPPLNVSDSDYLANPVFGYPSEDDWECNTPILPMTNNKADAIEYLKTLEPRGDTYIPTGMMWGYRVLTPEAPFAEMAGQPDGQGAHLILMSDGKNSKSLFDTTEPSEGHHYEEDIDDANEVTLETCDFIKSNNVTVFTIAFQVDDSETKKLLENCASSSNHAFSADSVTALQAVFAEAANSIRSIAIAE